jgi:hypothetical protein
MNGNRDPGYERFTRILQSAVSAQAGIQPAPYRAITMGPRHTFGAVLLQSADFGVSPILSEDIRGALNNDLGVMAERNAMLLTPRAPLVGYYDGDIKVGLPSLPDAYRAADIIVPPVVDLLFWKVPKDQYPYRGDDTFTYTIDDGESAAVPCFARRRVSVTVECLADGTIQIYAGNASATTIHDPGAGNVLIAMTTGQVETFEAHELITATGVSPWTPSEIVAVSRPDWLYFDVANTGTFLVTVYASDDR